ncbi:MAG: barstar family protein [Nocardiopsaceae bacterium]|nr:barstar family protein [Nocardiopsaceae bacterium]
MTPGPWLTVTSDPAPAVIDGRACRTRAAFFEEVARVLEFPSYFGRNWDALTDSLRDSLREAGAVTLVVARGDELLSAEPPEALATLLAIFGRAASDGLSLTLCAAPGQAGPLRRRVAAALDRPHR